jgi:hypothetical protein
MLRKISFALVTAIAVGSAALTPASARGFAGGWHGGGHGYRSFSYDRSYDSYGLATAMSPTGTIRASIAGNGRCEVEPQGRSSGAHSFAVRMSAFGKRDMQMV